ncbi:carotenoid oxygenase family protein [Streptomyces sp. NBC_00631]|uniref:carotenoid oxygenase family protein n=1 Tax=Streptomyces sp. NBC_00631 TaxID=2975793 RepID=UPI0030DE6347
MTSVTPGPGLIDHATDLGRTPLARVRLPSRVPFGFHGNWADHATLDRAVATLTAVARLV